MGMDLRNDQWRIDAPHVATGVARINGRAAAPPPNENYAERLCREADTRIAAVEAFFSTPRAEWLPPAALAWPHWTTAHGTLLWAIVLKCLADPGQLVAWSAIVVGPGVRSRQWPVVQNLITWGAARLAGLMVDLAGFTPAFMAPVAAPKPR
jgi:hypothetical protein